MISINPLRMGISGFTYQESSRESAVHSRRCNISKLKEECVCVCVLVTSSFILALRLHCQEQSVPICLYSCLVTCCEWRQLPAGHGGSDEACGYHLLPPVEGGGPSCFETTHDCTKRLTMLTQRLN